MGPGADYPGGNDPASGVQDVGQPGQNVNNHVAMILITTRSTPGSSFSRRSPWTTRTSPGHFVAFHVSPGRRHRHRVNIHPGDPRRPQPGGGQSQNTAAGTDIINGFPTPDHLLQKPKGKTVLEGVPGPKSHPGFDLHHHLPGGGRYFTPGGVMITAPINWGWKYFFHFSPHFSSLTRRTRPGPGMRFAGTGGKNRSKPARRSFISSIFRSQPSWRGRNPVTRYERADSRGFPAVDHKISPRRNRLQEGSPRSSRPGPARSNGNLQPVTSHGSLPTPLI